MSEPQEVPGSPGPTEPPAEIPSSTPAEPTEPPQESPPGSPMPDIPPPVREPGESPQPDELPGYTPEELPGRGTPGPGAPNPATDTGAQPDLQPDTPDGSLGTM